MSIQSSIVSSLGAIADTVKGVSDIKNAEASEANAISQQTAATDSERYKAQEAAKDTITAAQNAVMSANKARSKKKYNEALQARDKAIDDLYLKYKNINDLKYVYSSLKDRLNKLHWTNKADINGISSKLVDSLYGANRYDDKYGEDLADILMSTKPFKRKKITKRK